MKELDDGQVVPLEQVDCGRRDFCRAAVAGAVLVAIPGCGGAGGQHIGTGGLEDVSNDPTGYGNGSGDDMGIGGNSPADLAHNGLPPDFAGQKGPPPDFAMPNNRPPDLSMPVQATCGGGVYDTGKTPASIGANSAVYIRAQDAFICRDGSGWFSVSSICTHAGCTNSWSGSSFHCPCHGARFSLQGAVQSGPTITPLDHYTLCLTGNGTIGMDANTTVSASKRYSF